MPFRVPDGGVEAGAFGVGSEILIPPGDFPEVFLLSAQVLKTPVLDPVEESSRHSVLGLWAEIGTAGIRMSPSNPGIDEMKLSKSCIQTIGV
jgi:hypothetical protein